MQIEILPTLTHADQDLLGRALILTAEHPKHADAWSGGWFGRARVIRCSCRFDGVAFLVGEDAEDLQRRLVVTPDPLAIVLYLGPANGLGYQRLEKAVKTRAQGAGHDCRLVTGRAPAKLSGSTILLWSGETVTEPEPAVVEPAEKEKPEKEKKAKMKPTPPGDLEG